MRSRNRAKYSTVLTGCLLLLSLSRPIAADEPTLARLSFWLPPEQMEYFAAAYQEWLVPVLQEHLRASAQKGRTTVDSAFSRLFELENPAEIAAVQRTLRQNEAWQQALRKVASELGTVAADTSIRYTLNIYSAPAATGRIADVGAGTRQGLWQNFNIQDGLPSSSIHAIFQDRRGDLWFGTNRGVSRYDGARFETFSVEEGLAGNYVATIFEDREGHLWFDCEDGVSRYDGTRFASFGAEDGLTWGSRSIAQDQGGDLWFGNYEDLIRFDGQTFARVTTRDGLAANGVYSIFQDQNGHLWFATEKGVSRYDGKNFTTFTKDDGLPDGTIVSIAENAAGHLWFGMGRGVVARYDGQNFTTFDIGKYLDDVSLTNSTMIADRQGHLWMGSGSRGVVRYDGQNFANFTIEDGLAGNEIHAILEDRQGHLWIGTLSGGVSRYDGAQFTHFTTRDGLPSTYIFDVVQGRQGHLWFGARGGAVRYDGQKFTTFTTEDGLGGNWVWDALADSRGNLWFASPGGSITLTRYDGREFKTFTSEDGLPGTNVSAIYEDRAGNMWFGTSDGGASRYDGREFKTFTNEDGLPGNDVDAIYEDRAGNMWFGTWGDGVSRYDGREFKTFTSEDGLPGNNVSAIYEDRAGNMWFGTWSGVSRYDEEGFTAFTAADGLPPGNVESILEDRKGDLLFATFSSGLVRYDGRVFQTLTRRDGLTDNGVHKILQDRDGYIWITTDGGITRYLPSETPPSVFLKEVVADRAYASVAEIELASTQQFIRFAFQGRSFSTRPDQMVYLYRLQGFDPDWQQTRHEQVEYRDLPLGEYLFEVQAVDRDLNYSPEPVRVRVAIHPPYGAIAQLSGLGLALLGLALAGGYALKKKRAQLLAERGLMQAERALMQELENELDTARQLQMSLMPTASPQIAGLDIAGRCLTVNDVGGDFFQYFEGDGKLCICLADVTGHAMEAAVPVMMFSGVLKTEMRNAQSLEELFVNLNQILCETLEPRKYVCFAMGEFNLDTRNLRLSNSGCPYPYHYKASGKEVVELQMDAYPLGCRTDTEYQVIETQLEPGDRIVFCSDGIIEARNAAGEMFGFEQTTEVIRQGCQEHLSAEVLINRLTGAVEDFASGESQEDDITCVVMRVE